ncbi:MAG: AAA family ATPase, partial [Planctomycetes bacterium]|nr:AAA family ATPase [Planctomycetota bacterium]
RTVPAAAVPLEKVLGAEEILRIQEVVPRVPASDHVHRFALGLVRGSRPEEPRAPDYVRQSLSWGAGTRAAQSLITAAKARALLHGRFHVNTEDVEGVAVPVLAHRLVTSFSAEAEGVTPVGIVERLLRDVPRDGPKPGR